MFENLGWPEILALLLIALFVLGPERLPKILADIGRVLRKVRNMASSATADLNKDLGTNLDITDLNPKTFIRKHVLSEEDEEALKRPLQAAFEDLKRDTDGVRDTLRDTASGISARDSGTAAKSASAVSADDKTPVTDPPRGRTAKYDLDAT
ncbi:twin-arginine translocase TatA/TatE family subunit [Phytomonospora endophytica]|uniref:Sec-independent protein translocase protein TatB n=1 Tax=Phytomonospora endophytica TaxID=714109 RepID=A0A841FI03_9ACTN|nr:twin-arginine translocase TatA/TatE family subunit [Phytomonospora endophytica]MBB6033212.1 sec-independent protein translocase protein TatB [Phytomonospora endophytica]GIG65439.1 sec-independent protein translocase protein TatB [Phytomonospora endophytica]